MTLNTPHTAGLCALLFALGLSACDSDDNTAETNSSMLAPGATPGDEATLEGLDGNWATGCLASSGDATFTTTTISVADNVASVTQSIFTDNACTTAATPASIVTDRSLQFDGETSNTSLGDASNVVWTVESRTVDGTPDSDGVNNMVWDIMLITNDTLYFGDRSGSNDGSTEALRPNTLDEVNIFTMN